MPLSGNLWPAHPKPMPDELLSSWIVRIAQANGLKLQTFCDRTFGKERQLWNRDIDRLAPPWLLATLSRRTGTSLPSVQRTTLDRYLGRLYRRKQQAGQLRWILPVGVYHRTRFRHGMQFCSQCLAEDAHPYFRAIWRVAALTFCAKHRLRLHDRCPACNAPVAYHRRELGRPAATDPGPLSLCHTCSFDLRNAERLSFLPYEASIGAWLTKLASYITDGTAPLDIGYTDVLHQLCKTMVSLRKSANLAEFVADTIGTQDINIPRGRHAFESRPIEQRDHVIQLASWVLAAPQLRLHAAWWARAMHYNHLIKDFPSPPAWYRSIIEPLNRGRRQS